MSKARILSKEPQRWTTVAAFFADIDAGYTAPDGTVVTAGPVQYQAKTGASVTGLPVGWVPFGDVTPNHWADNTTPGTTDMTLAVQRWLNNGGGTTLPQVYAIDEVEVTNRVYVVQHPESLFKRRSDGSGADSALIVLAAGAANSVWDNLNVDGSRTALQATYDALNPTSPPIFIAGWREFVVDAPDVVMRNARVSNACGHPFVGTGDRLEIDGLYCKNHGTSIFFGYRSWSSTGLAARPTGAGGVGQNVRNVTSEDHDNNGSVLSQHAIDVKSAYGCNYSNFLTFNLGGDTSGTSPWVSAITIEACEDCSFDQMRVRDFTVPSTTLLHVGVSCPYSVNCRINPIVTGCGGTAIELNGSQNVIFYDIQVDGQYAVGSHVASIYRGRWNEYRSSKYNLGNLNCHIKGGYAVRCESGITLRDNGTTVSDVRVMGIKKDGIRANGEAFTDFFVGQPEAINSTTTLNNVEVAYCGGSGVEAVGGHKVRLVGCNIHDNGQISTETNRDGVNCNQLKSLELIGNTIEDTQGWTRVDGATFEPGQTGTAPVIYLDSYEDIGIGQTLTIRNATGAGDITGRIVSINGNDSVTLELASSATLSATGNTTALTGTWTGTSRNLTGTGGAASSEVTHLRWVTDGTEYRRIVRVNSDNAIVLDEPFTTNPSGATLTILEVDVSTARTQQNGLRAFSLVADMFLSGNALQNNVVADYNISIIDNVRAGSRFTQQYTRTIDTATKTQKTNIPRNIQIEGFATRVDTTFGGGTSWSLVRAKIDNTVLDTLASAIPITANSKASGAVPALNLAADDDYRLNVVVAGGAPVSGQVTTVVHMSVAADYALEDV